MWRTYKTIVLCSFFHVFMESYLTWYFYTYSLSCQESDKKIGTALISACSSSNMVQFVVLREFLIRVPVQL